MAGNKEIQKYCRKMNNKIVRLGERITFTGIGVFLGLSIQYGGDSLRKEWEVKQIEVNKNKELSYEVNLNCSPEDSL
jgi:hypothetical protein